MSSESSTVDISQTVEVKGTLEAAFKALLYRLGEGNMTPNGESLDLIIEPFAGGRWYRDRGNGIQHLWGHVQVIKAPVLLELCGPMFMSVPVLNHIEVKLEASGETTSIVLRHRAVGMIEPELAPRLHTGWQKMLGAVVGDFARATDASA